MNFYSNKVDYRLIDGMIDKTENMEYDNFDVSDN